MQAWWISFSNKLSRGEESIRNKAKYVFFFLKNEASVILEYLWSRGLTCGCIWHSHERNYKTRHTLLRGL
jgi:hypothetical protein